MLPLPTVPVTPLCRTPDTCFVEHWLPGNRVPAYWVQEQTLFVWSPWQNSRCVTGPMKRALNAGVIKINLST